MLLFDPNTELDVWEFVLDEVLKEFILLAEEDQLVVLLILTCLRKSSLVAVNKVAFGDVTVMVAGWALFVVSAKSPKKSPGINLVKVTDGGRGGTSPKGVRAYGSRRREIVGFKGGGN